MKRATITFPDELEKKLDAYLSSQRTPPSLSKVVQAALEEWLEQQKWAAYEVQGGTGLLELPVSDAETEPDVSANHDAYSLDAPAKPRADKDKREEAA